MGGLTKKDILEAVGKVNEGLSEEKKISTEGGLLNIVEEFLDVVDSIPAETPFQDTVLDVFNTLVTIEKQSATALEELCNNLEGKTTEEKVPETEEKVPEKEEEGITAGDSKPEVSESEPVKSEKVSTVGKKGKGKKKQFMNDLIAKGRHTKNEIVSLYVKEFGCTPGTASTILTRGRNPKYNPFPKLVVVDDEGIYSYE